MGDWNSIVAGCVVDGIATLACIPAIFQLLIYWALIFAGVIAVFIIALSGFKFVTSGGDPKRVGAARQTFIWAIIGLVIILTSFFVINLIAGITGVDCITSFGFTACN